MSYEEEIHAAKARFIMECSEWADLLIGDGVEGKQNGATFESLDPDKMVPLFWSEFGGHETHVELPPAQQKVWRAGYQLILDAHAATPNPEGVPV